MNRKYEELPINKVYGVPVNFKRVGWLSMPHAPEFGECRMAIKTYGWHNLWNYVGLARLADPQYLNRIFSDAILKLSKMLQINVKRKIF